MVSTMDAFNERAKAAAGDAESLGGLIQPLIEAQDTLGETNLARLQYNDEFKEKVAKAQKIVAARRPAGRSEGQPGRTGPHPGQIHLATGNPIRTKAYPERSRMDEG
jgi:hypothetical protein